MAELLLLDCQVNMISHSSLKSERFDSLLHHGVPFPTIIIWFLLNHVFEHLDCTFCNSKLMHVETLAWCCIVDLVWIQTKVNAVKSIGAWMICETSFQWLLYILCLQRQKLSGIHNCVNSWAILFTKSSVLQLQCLHA